MDENVGRRDEKPQSCTQISFSHTLKSEISLSLDREGYGYEIRETLGTSLDAIEHDFYQNTQTGQASSIMALVDDLLRGFSKENFGDRDGNYFPVVHGRTQDVKLFTLMIRQPRSFLARPFKHHKYTILAGMKKYVVENENEEFEDLKNKFVKIEDPGITLEEEDGTGAARMVEMETQAADCVNAGIRMKKDLGFLHLGKIDQEYIQDPDLREILEKTVLDSNKTRVFEDQELRLITSVIYSQCFAVKGNRKKEVEVDGGFNLSTIFAQLKGTIRMTDIPPNIAPRKNNRGPFLFQCCRVVFNKETNRLELPKGEIVGKTVRCKEEEKEDEYENTAVSLVEDEESNLTDFLTTDDIAKLEEIKDSVLKPTKNREKRKERVKKYLKWFVDALSTRPVAEKRVLSLDKPVTDVDCEFLRTIFVPANKNSSTLTFPHLFNDEKLQGYAIVLKILSDLSEETWDEIETAWAEQEEPLE
ncbi:unnamed protein product [Porites evermanni]|uniref:Uncharacterized protein n=1 Tax=Porites evermanni TaxID=104178 RepID=A0ABN8M750_9CNID|nr:unnamed protein product [Porites evermanni]